MQVVADVENHFMTFKGLRCSFQLKIISLVELTVFEIPKKNQTGKPFPMKGKSIWGKWIEGGYHKTKREVKCLRYVGPEMMIREFFCLCVGLGTRKDGVGWAWAKCGTCSKCSLLDSCSIKELCSLEGL